MTIELIVLHTEEQQVPIAGGNPVEPGTKQQYAQFDDPSSEGFVKDGNWVCEEMKLRYDFQSITPKPLKQVKHHSFVIGVG